MAINKKYFDVVITNNSFHLIECSSKPKIRDSALATLEKIEFILKNKLNCYSSFQGDDYLSQYDAFNILKEKSSKIHRGYKEKQSKLNWITRKIFSKEKKINDIHIRIDYYFASFARSQPWSLAMDNSVASSKALPLPNEMIQKVAKYLGSSDLAALAQVNHHGKAHAAMAIIKRAKKYGYEGENPIEAFKYINNLLRGVNKLAKQGIIPKKYFFYKVNTIYRQLFDLDKIFQKLQKDLSTEGIFSILSYTDLFSSSFQEFRNLFNLQKKWKISKVDNEDTKRKGGQAVVLAAQRYDKNNLELLLQHGADPNTPASNGSPPLHWAAQAGFADMVEILLKHGARVNEKANGHNTALSFACGYGNKALHCLNVKVVELLLQHGADPNIPDRNGFTPLRIAQESHFEEISNFLLANNAHL